MTLTGMMRTGVSGMNAQTNRLSSVADNIANSNTTGYKRSTTEFSSLVLPSVGGNYSSGGVTTTVRNTVSQQGDLKFTTSGTDLAINGNGFFIVENAQGQTFLTRAGNFVPDDQGRLVNAAGFTLMGYSYANGPPAANANGFGGLEAVNVRLNEITAYPSRQGTFSANLPASAEIVPAGNLPSPANPANAQYTAKSTLLAYDNLGREVLLDVYSTKTADNTWQIAVFNNADAAPDTSFPYAQPALATQTLNFVPTTGKLTAASANAIAVPIPGGQNLNINLSGMSQLGDSYTVGDAELDGSGPSALETVEINQNGKVLAQYGDGSIKELYRIPLATVTSPDQLAVLPGNVFAESGLSGSVKVGFADEGANGAIIAGALESSNVDVAEELTSMIESQRSYTANSKVFQTGSELMDVLINLKR